MLKILDNKVFNLLIKLKLCMKALSIINPIMLMPHILLFKQIIDHCLLLPNLFYCQHHILFLMHNSLGTHHNILVITIVQEMFGIQIMAIDTMSLQIANLALQHEIRRSKKLLVGVGKGFLISHTSSNKFSSHLNVDR